MKKRVVSIVLCLLGLTVAGFAGGAKEQQGAAAPAADYPRKTIQVVVPANPGGATDLSARLIAKYLEKDLGQSVVIVNTAGAGGTIASRRVKDSDADGYTALYFHNSMLVSKLMGIAEYSYEAFEIAGIVVQDNSLSYFVSGKSDIKNLNDLISKAKANPETLTYATETGALTHLMGMAFQEASGMTFNLVDVGTESQKIAALKGDKVDVMPALYSTNRQYVESGDFRALSFFSDQRNPLVPNIPTAKEQGINFQFDGYYFAFFFPKGTPKPIVEKMTAALSKVSQDPSFLEEAKRMNFEIKFMNNEQALAHIQRIAAVYDKFKDKIIKK